MSSIYVLFDSPKAGDVFDHVNTKTDYCGRNDIFLFYSKYVQSESKSPDKIFSDLIGRYILPLHDNNDMRLLLAKMKQANQKLICVLDGASPIDVVSFLKLMDEYRHEIIFIHFTNGNVNIS